MLGMLKGIFGGAGAAVNVKHGSHNVDARPYIDEAFNTLPFINLKYKDLYIGFFKDHWDRGTIERVMIKSSLPADFFAALQGRSERDAIQAITARIFFRVVAEARKRNEAEVRKSGIFPWDRAQCDINEAYCCAGARKFQGKIVPEAKRTAFPLSDCDADACSCHWILLTKARKK